MAYRIKDERGEYLSGDFRTAEEAYAYVSEYICGISDDSPGGERVTKWSVWHLVANKEVEVREAGVLSEQAGVWWLARSMES